MEGARLKELRKTLGLTLEKFGERIGLKKAVMSEYENGRRPINSRTRLAICREYGVSEKWLETGEGEMFMADTQAYRQLREKVDRMLSDESDAFRAALVDVVMHLNSEQIDILKEYARKYYGVDVNQSPEGSEAAASFADPAAAVSADGGAAAAGTDPAAFDREGQTRSNQVKPMSTDVKPRPTEPGREFAMPAPLLIGSAYPFEDGQKAADGRPMDGSEPLSVKEEIEIAKKVEDYRRQLRIEKRVEARSSALSGGEEKKEA